MSESPEHRQAGGGAPPRGPCTPSGAHRDPRTARAWSPGQGGPQGLSQPWRRCPGGNTFQLPHPPAQSMEGRWTGPVGPVPRAAESQIDRMEAGMRPQGALSGRAPASPGANLLLLFLSSEHEAELGTEVLATVGRKHVATPAPGKVSARPGGMRPVPCGSCR